MTKYIVLLTLPLKKVVLDETNKMFNSNQFSRSAAKQALLSNSDFKFINDSFTIETLFFDNLEAFDNIFHGKAVPRPRSHDAYSDFFIGQNISWLRPFV